MEYNFLFGKPVLPATPTATGKRKKVFVLGAYPSALHIRWAHPELKHAIVAIAVDNEPMPFWTGTDEDERIAAWKGSIEWREDWGSVLPCRRFNGPSGVWVRDKVLCPLRIATENVWMTDSLDTYFESDGARDRMTKEPVPNILSEHSIPAPHLEAHPSENLIVSKASEEHQRTRLLRELSEASPELMITLGNAALRVVGGLLGREGSGVPSDLSKTKKPYGSLYHVASKRFGDVDVLPLAHPGAPDRFQKLHDQWIEAQTHSPVWTND